MQKENAKQLKETRRQIGGLGNKFDGYTEAMAMPSIRGLLEREFDADMCGAHIGIYVADLVMLRVLRKQRVFSQLARNSAT